MPSKGAASRIAASLAAKKKEKAESRGNVATNRGPKPLPFQRRRRVSLNARLELTQPTVISRAADEGQRRSLGSARRLVRQHRFERPHPVLSGPYPIHSGWSVKTERWADTKALLQCVVTYSRSTERALATSMRRRRRLR